MTVNAIFQIAGLLLCGGVFASVAIGFAQGAQRMVAERQKFRLTQELLRRQIEAVTVTAGPNRAGWDGFRKFRIKWKVRESESCHSFYLIPHDGQPLPAHRAGQYVTVRVKLPGHDQNAVRCYSLSDAPGADHYRLTIKKLMRSDGQAGAVSGYMNDHAAEGDILDVAAPKGQFCWDPLNDRPLVLLAGGIGITPLLSILSARVASSADHVPIYLFYSVKHGDDHVFKQTLSELNRQRANIHIWTCYSRPRDHDQLGRDYDVAGRLTIDQLRDRLPSNNFEFYLCGPKSFNEAMRVGLTAWGVPDNDIDSEAFGPDPTARQLPAPTNAATTVRFCRSDCQSSWSDPACTLLDLADEAGVSIESGCRTGNCGTCVTAVRRGRVHYTTTPSANVDKGSCLPCVCVPDGPLELDA